MWTRKSYDALYRWPNPSQRAAVRATLKADGLDDVIVRLDAADSLAVWYRITREAAEAVGPTAVAASARDAETELEAISSAPSDKARIAAADALDDVPATLARIRNSSGITQAALASLIGVTPITVSRWERAVTRPISAAHLKRIAALARKVR